MSNFILGNFEQHIITSSSSIVWSTEAVPLPAGYFSAASAAAWAIRGSYGGRLMRLYEGSARIRIYSGALPTNLSGELNSITGAAPLLTSASVLTSPEYSTTGRVSYTFAASAATLSGTATWFSLDFTPYLTSISTDSSMGNPFIVGTVGTTGTPDLLLADANITQGVIYTLPTLSIKMTPNVAEF